MKLNILLVIIFFYTGLSAMAQERTDWIARFICLLKKKMRSVRYG